jgi:hypothetical protein
VPPQIPHQLYGLDPVRKKDRYAVNFTGTSGLRDPSHKITESPLIFPEIMVFPVKVPLQDSAYEKRIVSRHMRTQHNRTIGRAKQKDRSQAD